jgi:glyoxylase-like metal-dependent hydrolase (beta-lactamase superfamily II)
VSEPVRITPLALGTRLTLKAGCTLLSDGGQHVLVDPGCFPSRGTLEAALRAAAGIGVADLHTVFFTHLHFDHYNDLGFSDLPRVAMPRREANEVQELSSRRHDLQAYRSRIESTHEVVSPVFMRQFLSLREDPRYDLARVSFRPRLALVEAGQWLTDRLRLIDLAGHSVGQLGLRTTTVHGDTAVVADAALSAEDYQRPGIGHHLVVQDSQRLLQSRARLAQHDCIVPGHGAWFHPRTGTRIQPIEEHCHV